MPVLRLPIFLLLTLFIFLSASMPLVSDLQNRIGELVGEQEQQAAALISAQKEKDRLEAVEADLSKIVQTLRAEITSMKPLIPLTCPPLLLRVTNFARSGMPLWLPEMQC